MQTPSNFDKKKGKTEEIMRLNTESGENETSTSREAVEASKEKNKDTDTVDGITEDVVELLVTVTDSLEEASEKNNADGAGKSNNDSNKRRKWKRILISLFVYLIVSVSLLLFVVLTSKSKHSADVKGGDAYETFLSLLQNYATLLAQISTVLEDNRNVSQGTFAY